MPFHTEPDGYSKTALSDLQGAWSNLRSTVVESMPFPEDARLLFHIDEAMSWECVRDLERMGRALLLVQNLAARGPAPDEVRWWLGQVRESFDEVVAEVAQT